MQNIHLYRAAKNSELHGTLSKNLVIHHRGERRVRRVLRLLQPLLRFSCTSAFSVCSAVKSKDIAISLENSTVPCSGTKPHIKLSEFRSKLTNSMPRDIEQLQTSLYVPLLTDTDCRMHARPLFWAVAIRCECILPTLFIKLS